MTDISLLIITGMSGAGKASAARHLEDLSYKVVSNLPLALLPNLLRYTTRDAVSRCLAVVIDSLSADSEDPLSATVSQLKTEGYDPTILFLDASDAALIQRFKETRRQHPLFDPQEGIVEAIRQERQLLEPTRSLAHKIIDTSDLRPQQLRQEISQLFSQDSQGPAMSVTLTSFGFKHGLPLDADLVFDVRFLSNPFYVESLKNLTGEDPQVIDYVLQDNAAEPLLERLLDLLEFVLPLYVREGKAYLTIAIGCTGGHHRSVVISERLAPALRGSGYAVFVKHRDIAR